MSRTIAVPFATGRKTVAGVLETKVSELRYGACIGRSGTVTAASVLARLTDATSVVPKDANGIIARGAPRGNVSGKRRDGREKERRQGGR